MYPNSTCQKKKKKKKKKNNNNKGKQLQMEVAISWSPIQALQHPNEVLSNISKHMRVRATIIIPPKTYLAEITINNQGESWHSYMQLLVTGDRMWTEYLMTT